MSSKNSSEHNENEKYIENEEIENIGIKKNISQNQDEDEDENENDENVNENLKNINKSRSLISPTEEEMKIEKENNESENDKIKNENNENEKNENNENENNENEKNDNEKNENEKNEKEKEENDIDPLLIKSQEKEEEEEIKYNPEPFLTPDMKKGKIIYYSKMQKAIEQYNKIKKQINNIILKEPPKNYSESSHKIGIMLDNMNKLNDILTIIIENGRIFNNKKLYSKNNNVKKKTFLRKNQSLAQINKKPQTIEETNQKLVNMYKNEYEKIKERLEQVTSKNYVESKRKRIEELNAEIELLEKDNKSLKRDQQISESLLKKEIHGDSISNHIKEKMNECEKYNNIYNSLLKKIENGEQMEKDNEIIIKNLQEREEKLEAMAKQMYGIYEFDNVKDLEKKEQKKKSEMEKLKKQIEIIDKALISNKKKYENEYKQNEFFIQNLHNSKDELLTVFKEKKDQLEKCEKKIKNIEDEIEKLHFLDGQVNISEIKPNEEKKIIIDKEPIKLTVSNNTEKEMIIKELEKKSKEEELIHEQQEKLNKSIVLKNISLKPNFSFTHGLMTDENKLNKSLNIRQNYVKNNLDNDEIKEDIIIDNNKEEDKKQNEEKDNNTKKVELQPENLEPITIGKNKKEENVLENLRSQALNTAIINKEDLENKDLENLENHIKNEESDSNEQEHIFNNMSQKIDFGDKKNNNDEEQIVNEYEEKEKKDEKDEKEIKKEKGNNDDDSEDVIEEIY